MHMTRMRWASSLFALGALAAATTAWAQSGSGYDASFTAFDAGGTTVSGGSYVLQVAAGQAVAGNASGSSYSLDIGVLAGGSGAAASGSPTPSPTPSGGVGPYKGFGPQIAKDGVQ
ncbi:MAG: hypothetical protein HYX53_10785 [Chloroflexi bacterium]|nr:hypothetical protein [Chloroflexota bacterium]